MKKIALISSVLLVGCLLCIEEAKCDSDSSDSSKSSKSSESNESGDKHRKKHKYDRPSYPTPDNNRYNNPAYVPQPPPQGYYGQPPYPYGGYYQPPAFTYYPPPPPAAYSPAPATYPPAPAAYPQYQPQGAYPIDPRLGTHPPTGPGIPGGISTLDHSLKVNKEYKENGHHSNGSGSSNDI